MIVETRRQLSLSSETARALEAALDAMVSGVGLSTAIVVDRAGQVLARAGSADRLDLVTFATLACADFNANEQLAQLVGERDFRTLSHRGREMSVLIEDAGGRALLVALFGRHVEVGLVRIAARRVAGELAAILNDVARRAVEKTDDVPALLAGAEEEIDRMFDW